MGKQWKQCETLFLGGSKSLQMVTAVMKLKDLYLLDCSPLGSSVHGISWARILEWGAISFPGALHHPRIQPSWQADSSQSEPSGKPNITNLDSILKSRDITLPTKVRLVKAMVFPVVMYGCESWTIKKAEHQRTDAFELWCWKTLESPLDCKEIKPVNTKGKSALNIHRKD